MRPPIEPGSRVERLEFIEYTGDYLLGEKAIRVGCDCGEEKVITENRFRAGEVRSCGCLVADTNIGNQYAVIHGESYSRLKRSSAPIWMAWKAMKGRCTTDHPKIAPYYKWRGITYDPRWASYKVFREDILNSIGPKPTRKHSLDRIDNNGNYCRGNVRWSTQSEQVQNQGQSPRLTYNGEAKTLIRWAREMNLDPRELRRRYRDEWPDDEILGTPTARGYTDGSVALNSGTPEQIRGVDDPLKSFEKEFHNDPGEHHLHHPSALPSSNRYQCSHVELSEEPGNNIWVQLYDTSDQEIQIIRRAIRNEEAQRA